MQQVGLVLTALVVLGAILLVFSGASVPMPVPVAEAPAPVPAEGPAAVRLEIGRVISWDNAPVDLPVLLTGNPAEIRFVIVFPNHIARVSAVDSSTNWATWIVRSNRDGEILVEAKRVRETAGTHRFLTLRVRRLERANAEIAVLPGTVWARGPSGEPLRVEVVPGGIFAPSF